jgi:hypothetical protein
MPMTSTSSSAPPAGIASCIGGYFYR